LLTRDRIWLVVLIPLIFVLMGLAFIGKAGLHYDASSELACFYTCSAPAFQVNLFGHRIPIMVLQYLGTLKTWLYLPILKYLEVTPFVLRLPLLLAGAGSIWLFFCILDRVSGRRAAIAGALLLATDASFLLATCYDFGPIVLLHLLLLAGILLLLRFDETHATGYLALAFFLFGIALWHKALFVWMLGGLGVASLVVFPKRILTLLSPARVAVAAVSFCLGASPLIYYNAVTHGATLQTGSVMSGAAPLSQKLLVARKTMDSSVMFGWLTEDLQPETALPATGFVNEVSVKLNRLTGSLGSNWMLYAFLASCCLVPWLWFTPSKRAALFALVYLAVAWGQMVILPNTGATLHHVILLWPFPHFLIAIAVAEFSLHLGRPGNRALTAVFLAILGSNVLVINHYYAGLVTRGTTVIWTDAVYPLFDYLDSLDGYHIVTVDWGYSATLCLLSDGQMPLNDISFALLANSDEEGTAIHSLMLQPDTLFVDHTDGGEQFPGVRERLNQLAERAGYTKHVLNVISDRNNRPRFEISRYIQDKP
jgi:4-amino-4-deoxy-L-arabinose transferase-like glycosyltransferase